MPSHRVRLHLMSLHTPNVPVSTHLSSSQTVFGARGIELVAADMRSLTIPAPQATRFTQVDGTCEWTITGGEFAEIQDLGGHIPPSDIAVYFVNRFSQSIVGCGGHVPGMPAAFIAANAGRWDMGHEIGHILLGEHFRPVHSNDGNNIMYATYDGFTTGTPILDERRTTHMKRSVLCMPIGCTAS